VQRKRDLSSRYSAGAFEVQLLSCSLALATAPPLCTPASHEHSLVLSSTNTSVWLVSRISPPDRVGHVIVNEVPQSAALGASSKGGFHIHAFLSIGTQLGDFIFSSEWASSVTLRLIRDFYLLFPSFLFSPPPRPSYTIGPFPQVFRFDPFA